MTEPGQNTSANSIASGVHVRSLTASLFGTKSNMDLAGSRFLSATSPSTTERVGRPPNPYTVSVGYASNPPPLKCSKTESRLSAARMASRTSMTLGG